MSHGNARLTPHGRRLLVKRVRVDRRPVAHVAKEMGISRQCAHRWVARFDAEGEAGLRDRSSRPRSSPNATPAELVALVLACRDTQRVGRDEVARRTGVPARTVSRILARHHRPPLAWLDPTTGQLIRASRSTALRYERDAPGDLIHIDVKKLGRIPDGGGWRVNGRGERPQRLRGLGFDYVHAAVDDHSRMAYAEVLPDEKGATAAGSCCAPPGTSPSTDPGPRGDHRQRLRLPALRCLPRRRGGSRGQTAVHQAPLPLAEREGGEIQPHPAGRVGLPPTVRQQHRTGRRP